MVGGNAPKSWLQDSPGLFSLIFGAVGFPFAFTMIVVCGAELYTSLCAYTAAAWWEGKMRIPTLIR
jgi:formate/nitrite transporter FocA (FNT family)